MAEPPGGSQTGAMTLRILAVLALLFAASHAEAGGTLRFGLEFDPDVLDPARSGSYTDRIVFASMCDQLIDVDAKLNFVPQLATAWEWSPDNLALTLHLRPMYNSRTARRWTRPRFGELQTQPSRARKPAQTRVAAGRGCRCDRPADRAYPPLRPLCAAAVAAGQPARDDAFARASWARPDAIIAHPVCAGPFRFTQRIAQDRIVLDRFPGYWNAAAIDLDRIVFQLIVDTTVRLVNLQSGALDIVNRLGPTDVAAVHCERTAAPGHLAVDWLSAHLVQHRPPPGNDSPLARDPRVREAFEKSIDRGVINQVVMDGQFIPSNQTEPPGSRYWDPDYPVPPRDVEGAKALLRAAGTPHVAFTLLVANDPVNGQIGQVIQSMAAEAGFDVSVRQVESTAGLAQERAGDYQAAMVIWSGRPDPDQNISIWMGCTAFLNWGQYCNKSLDALFVRGASITDPAQRVPVYHEIQDIAQRDRSHLVLFHFKWLWGMSDKVDGFVPMPDGITRPTGLRLKN